MPKIEEAVAPPRKVLPIIWVVDTSGSMLGDRISAVNEAMHDAVDIMREVSNNNPDAELKIGVLEFSSGARWVTGDDNSGDLVYIDDFFWNDLGAAGLTDLGDALRKLEVGLSRSVLMKDYVGYKIPVIIFLSDGEPTDDWEGALEDVASKNKWFKYSVKIAIAIGDEANNEKLARLVGHPEAVIRVDQKQELIKLIKVVSMTASKIGSDSRIASDNATDAILKVIKEDDILDSDDESISPELSTAKTPDDDSEDPFSGDNWDDDGW